jgi:mannose-6-phosphate isomerase class I
VRARLSTRRVGLDDSSAELRKTKEELTTKLKRAEDALADYRERETLIAETLLTAQSAANELRERAERDLEQERADAEELRRRAKQNRAEVASEIEWLRTMRTEMHESIHSLLLNTLHVLDGESRAETKQEPSLTDDLESRPPRPDQPSAQAETE